MILVKNRLKKLKKDTDDEMLKQLKYSPPIYDDDDFDFILDDTEFENKATQIPDITNNYTQTIKEGMVDKETDTYDELNKKFGNYILKMGSKNFKSKEVSRAEKMTQANAIPVSEKSDERSSSSSSDSEGLFTRNIRRGFRLAEIGVNTALFTGQAVGAVTELTLDGLIGLYNLTHQQQEDEEENQNEVADVISVHSSPPISVSSVASPETASGSLSSNSVGVETVHSSASSVPMPTSPQSSRASSKSSSGRRNQK